MARLLVLFVTAFVDMVGFTMVLPLLPYYATDFGANAAVVGAVVSAFSVAQLACAPVWGRLSDHYGRRPAILAGLVITAVAYVIFGLADSLALLFISRVVQGVGGGTIGVVQAYVADASTPEQRTKSLGWLTAVTSLGAVAGPAFGSLAIALGGQQAPGFAAAGLAVLVAIFAWRYLRESRALRLSATMAAMHRPAPGSSRAALLRVARRWEEPAPRLIWIYTVAIGAFYGTVPVMPLLLEQRLGITEQTVGYVIMYLGGIGVVVRALVLGRMVNWFGETRTAQVGIGFLAAGLAVVSVSRTLPVLWISLTLMPIGTGFLFPCVTGMLTHAVSSRERGLYMGVQHTFGGVSRVAFPIVAGILMDGFGLGVPFWIAGFLVLATVPLTRGLEKALAEEELVPAEEPLVNVTDELPVPAPTQSLSGVLPGPLSEKEKSSDV